MSASGVGKTTLEMHAAGTFVSWGACVSLWTIDDGRDYPHLGWENAPGEIIAGPTYGGGTGTAENPYLIATAEHLSTIGLCTCHQDKHFKLVADIDLSNGTWTRSVVPSFSGVFDGNGHIISGLTITGGGYLGLFGQLGSSANGTSISLRSWTDKGIERQASRPKRLLLPQSNPQGGLPWISIPKDGRIGKSVVFGSVGCKCWTIKTCA